MRGFSTGRCIGQEELELWTLPGWFPALGKPGFPQIPQLRRLGVINGISETDRLQIPTPERAPGPEAGITAGYAPVGAAGTENHPQILLRRQFYKEIGAPELGFLLTCSADFVMAEGFGDRKS